MKTKVCLKYFVNGCSFTLKLTFSLCMVRFIAELYHSLPCFNLSDTVFCLLVILFTSMVLYVTCLFLSYFSLALFFASIVLFFTCLVICFSSQILFFAHSILLLFGVVFYLSNAITYGTSLYLDRTILCLPGVILYQFDTFSHCQAMFSIIINQSRNVLYLSSTIFTCLVPLSTYVVELSCVCYHSLSVDLRLYLFFVTGITDIILSL